MELQEVRIDKWLWAVRAFKTRTLAIEACRAGHVKLDGESVKPARELRTGEIITLQRGPIRRTLKVRALLDRRVGADKVPEYVEDLTPPEEYARRRALEAQGLPTWDRGQGRPTKRDRRVLQKFLQAPSQESD
jgi:ribosome-associated heat shock protein Hsp15